LDKFNFLDLPLIEHIKKLFPLCRSITGDGLRETLGYFEKFNKEFKRIKFATGEKVLGGESQNNSVILAFLDFKIGKTIKSIRVPNLTYVLKFRSIYEEKDMVESIENCASRHMMLVLDGGIKELKEFKDKLQIDYFNG